MLSLILFGTNVERKKRGNTRISTEKKETMQIMEGKGVKCEVVEDKDSVVYREEEVPTFVFAIKINWNNRG